MASFEILILEMAREQIEVEESGKMLDVFLNELIVYFESLGGSVPDSLWCALLEAVKWCIHFKGTTHKHLEKSMLI